MEVTDNREALKDSRHWHFPRRGVSQEGVRRQEEGEGSPAGPGSGSGLTGFNDPSAPASRSGTWPWVI